MRSRVLGAGKILLFVGLLVATFLLSAALAMRAALRAREVEVPNLAGRTVEDATRILAEVGLQLRLDDNRRIDPQVPSGRVAQQDPVAGVLAREARGIKVWLSAGPRSAVVPPLVGQTERSARMRLSQDGLDVATVSEFRSQDYPSDAVVAQLPAAASRADAPIAMLINRGEEGVSYVMPDLIGTDGARASDVLRARGFRVAIVGQQPYPGVPPGTVVRQEPAGGFRVAPADTISIEVSR